MTKHETARRVQSRIQIVLSAAITAGLRAGPNPAEWKGHLENIFPHVRRSIAHHKALAYQEVPALMAVLKNKHSLTSLVLQFVILNATRSSESVFARYDELDGNVITIGAERMKAGQPHQITSESFDQLGHYTLIIDETLDVIKQLDDVRLYSEYMLMGRGTVKPDTKHYQFDDPVWFDSLHKKDVDGFVANSGGNKDSMFKLCRMAAQNQLYRYSEGNWFQMLPIELLTRAKNVIVMTHGFENSFMHCWLKLHNIQHHYIDNDKLGLESESKLKQQLKSNLMFIAPTKVFEDLADGRKHESLSISHWQQLDDSNQLKTIGSSINHLVKGKLKADKDNIFWTCPKAYKQKLEIAAPKLRGKITLQQPLELADVNEDFIDKSVLTEADDEQGTTHSSWLPCNIKARNDFGHITNCLYAFSLNPPPSVLNLLTATSGIELEKIKATFKLNNLLQFIYRGSIRQNKPMNLCIIPADTRALLDDFLKHH
jgi:hypothetical protein